jgi:hypothetical protein
MLRGTAAALGLALVLALLLRDAGLQYLLLDFLSSPHRNSRRLCSFLYSSGIAMMADAKYSQSGRQFAYESQAKQRTKRQAGETMEPVESLSGDDDFGDVSAGAMAPVTSVLWITVTATGPLVSPSTPSIATVVKPSSPSDVDVPSYTRPVASSVGFGILSSSTIDSVDFYLTSSSTTADSPASSTRSSDGAISISPSPGDNAPTVAPWSDDSASSSSSLGGGALAGITIVGAVIIIALIGGSFFWLRKKRTTRDGDMAELGSSVLSQEPVVHSHQTQNQTQTQTQELDSTHCSAYAVNASQERKTDSAPAELLNDEHGYTSPVPHHVPQQPPADTAGYSVSANVEAQRRREMEWLEMEEERIRKRRELLALQGGTPN